MYANTSEIPQKWYPEYKGPWSPWGSTQQAYVICRGVRLVSTASHGGLKISEKLAEKTLSVLARSYAIHANGAYWFEEDCLCAMAYYEQPSWMKPFLEPNESLPLETCLKTLQMYYPEYLVQRGLVTNIPPQVLPE